MINLINSADAIVLKESLQCYNIKWLIVSDEDLGTAARLAETLLTLINFNDIKVHEERLLDVGLVAPKHVLICRYW